MRGINYLHPSLQKKAQQLVDICAILGLKVAIGDTLRTKAEQDALYAQGRTKPGSIVTNAKYPKSPHNWGVAFDIYRNDGTGAYNEAGKFFETAGTVGKLLGLTWGGDWKNFVDRPHFEMPEFMPNSSTSYLIGKYGTPDNFVGKWGNETVRESKYEYKDGIHFVRIPVERFKLLMWDKKKKTTAIKNYFNAGFFAGGHRENGVEFTMPVANLVADIGDIGLIPLKYLREWGRVENGKARLDCRRNGSAQFQGKSVSTLIVTADGAKIQRCNALTDDVLYAVSGVPVIRNGQDVSYKNDVLGEGWKGSELGKAWHGFLAVDGSNYITYMGWCSKTKNLISTCEAYNKFKKYGFRDVIKLDGGGSYVLDHNGKNVAVTGENRQINSVGLY